MEQGVIFTKDNKDIEVFFLKPQGSFSPHPHEPNTWVVNDEETAQALIDDNVDCCSDSQLMNEQDVNENSAGGGVQWNPLEKAHLSYLGGKGEHPPPYFDDPMVAVDGKKDWGCPVGHKGETGWKGYNSLYDAIFDTIKRFENSQLNIASETAQEILAMSIEGKVKHFYDEK